MKTAGRLLLLALLAVCAGCTQEPEIDLQGTWHGQWAAGSLAGSLDVTFGGKRSFGDMKLYDVTLVAHGASCPTGEDRGTGDRTVAFNQSDVRFVIEMVGGSSSDGVFAFDGAMFGGGEVDGTYRMTSDACSVCTCGLGTTGHWTIFR